MSTLHVYPRAVHVEEALEEELAAGGAVVVGQGRLSARQLLERGFAARAHGVRIGPVGERLLVDAVADDAAGEAGALAPLAGTRGFTESLARIFSDWTLAGLAPGVVAAVGRRAGPASRRIGALASLYAQYADRLGDRLDEAGVARAALDTLRDPRALPFLAGVDRVAVYQAAADPRLLDIVEALATAGLRVEPELPLVASVGQPRPLLERAVDPLARRVERLVDLPIEPRYLAPGTDSAAPDDDSPRARLIAELFRPAADPRRVRVLDAAVDISTAPTPEVEARAVARRARDLIDSGVAPQSIAIAAREAGQRERVAGWLARYGVPFVERPGRSALTAVPARLALRLTELVDDGVPREALIALVSSRYVNGWIEGEGSAPVVPPHRIARALREAGVRDATEEHGVSGYGRRLGELARTVAPERDAEIRRIASRVEEWLALLASLPAEGTFAQHASALAHVIDRLGIRRLARGYIAEAEAGLADVERVAHDHASVAALERLLADLPRAAARTGLVESRVTRGRFSRLLEGVLGGESVRPGGARGSAVELTAPEWIAGRRFAHLIACDLVDGVLPARGADDPLLSDDDRRRFNRLAGREALRLASATLDREPLVFLELCAAATTRLHLFHATADASGRPLLPSPYLDEIERVTGVAARRLQHDPIPRAADCRLPAELRARAMLEADAPADGRLSPRDPDASAALIAAVAAAEPRAVARARTVAVIERRRLAFFDGEVAADRYSGRIADPALLAALPAALPGTAEQPLSSSAIEDYAQCGFRFFAARLLGARPPEETGDELDPLAAGRLHHRVLERFFRDLQAREALPLVGADHELRLLDEAIDAILADWDAGEQRGHPALFAVRGRRVRRELHALVRAEGAGRFFAPHRPTHFEHRFKVSIAAPTGDSAGSLHLYGAIDRIDVDEASAVVIDYKSGRASRYRDLLDLDALLVTSFQLPLYAAAARATLGMRSVSAHYLSIRDAQPTAALADDPRLSFETTAAATPSETGAQPPRPPTVGDAIWLVHGRMRAGDFAVAPRSCDYCALGAACRVVLRLRADEGGP